MGEMAYFSPRLWRRYKKYRTAARTNSSNDLMINDSTVTHTDRAPSWMRPMPIAVESKIGMNMGTPWWGLENWKGCRWTGWMAIPEDNN